MQFHFQGLKMSRYFVAISLAALLTISVGHAQDNLDLEVIVEEVSAFPGEQNVVISIYMKNYHDSVAGFNMWLILDRPDIMEFQIVLDTTGTLISGWESMSANSVGGLGHDLALFAMSNSMPPYTKAIDYPQYGEIPLVKLVVDVYDIPDTMTDRTVNIHVVTEPLNNFCFSDPYGFCIGYVEGELDTTKVTITDGSLTVLVPICGDIDGSGGDPNVVDLTYFAEYLFNGGPPPPVLEMANVDGDNGINVVDLTYLVAYLFEGGPAPDCSPDSAQAIIADHQIVVDFDSIPTSYIEQVKSDYRMWYVRTSHGTQIETGMSILRDSSSLYDYNNGPGTLYLEVKADDLGHNGDTSWVPITRQRLDQPGNDINVVMWSWCGGCSDNTEEGINIYLNAVNQLEQDYPDVTFIYMTGHLDGTGPSGNLYARNNQIRAYCAANNKILFDFADVESYDPDGTYYPDETDYCYWCYDWCASHPCPSCGCAHSHCFNCYQKGKVFWWMMARIAGWDGN